MIVRKRGRKHDADDVPSILVVFVDIVDVPVSDHNLVGSSCTVHSERNWEERRADERSLACGFVTT